MRLTCPNCGAEYEVSEGVVPAAGRHVQCSACHTRWFVRGAERHAPSEDQILNRLEARGPRPRPTLVAERGASEPASAVEPAVVRVSPVAPVVLPAAGPEPVLDTPDPVPSESAPSEAEDEAEDFAWAAPAQAERSTPALVPSAAQAARREPLTKPGSRPSVAQPGSVADAGPPRPVPRLDLGDAARPAPEPAPPARSRFARGFLIVLIPALLAFGAYRYGDAVARSVPAAAPALASYADLIDGLRTDLEQRLEDYRDGGT